MVGKARAFAPGIPKARARVPRKVIGGMEAGAEEIVQSIGDSFIAVYRAEPLTRIAIVKDGLPADYLDKLARRLKCPRTACCQRWASRRRRSAAKSAKKSRSPQTTVRVRSGWRG